MQQERLRVGGELWSPPCYHKTPLPLALTSPAFQEGQPSMRFNYGAGGCLIYYLFCVKPNSSVLQSWASSSLELSGGLAIANKRLGFAAFSACCDKLED